MGDAIRSLMVRTRNREMEFQILAYDAHRLGTLSLLNTEGFYRAGLQYNEGMGYEPVSVRKRRSP